MSAYEPNSHLREVLIFCFNMKKSVAGAHRMLSSTCGEAAISERTCREWFQRFKNGDFDVEDQHVICDEAHFWLNGYVIKQNYRIWSEANPKVYVETPLHPEKVTVWCALWTGGFLLQKR
ncbi:mariner Mos1 transposase [Trichonephila clavipes]|nr:mariner Mos1 transposase [Trichonephila clavipes]